MPKRNGHHCTVIFRCIFWMKKIYMFLGVRLAISQHDILSVDPRCNMAFLEHNSYEWFNTLRSRQKGTPFRRRHFQVHYLERNVWIPIELSLKLVLKGPIKDIPALVKIMAWRRPSLYLEQWFPMQICVTQPQWVILDHHGQVFITFSKPGFVRLLINSVSPSDAYMRPLIGSSLVQLTPFR